jgi:hypothetical protein
MTNKTQTESTSEMAATDATRGPRLVLIQGGRTDDTPRAAPYDNLTKSERDLRTFMAIAQAVAIEDAKYMPTTPEIRQQAQELMKKARARLAELDNEEKEGAGDVR